MVLSALLPYVNSTTILLKIVFSILVKLDISFHVGLYATSILNGRRSLAATSDVVCM